jgi:hypothetical protein
MYYGILKSLPHRLLNDVVSSLAMEAVYCLLNTHQREEAT